jgi:hypothetical protein
MELIVSMRPEIRTLGSAIQVMLCSKGAVKTPDLQEAKALLEALTGSPGRAKEGA